MKSIKVHKCTELSAQDSTGPFAKIFSGLVREKGREFERVSFAHQLPVILFLSAALLLGSLIILKAQFFHLR